jgi:phosphomannomutase
MRVSSPAIAAAFIAGAREQGADVIDYGMLGTDLLYYAVVNDRLEGGAQITASHNPGEYNGIKMVRAGALPLSGDAGIGDIRDMIASDRLPAPAPQPGNVSTRDILPGYVEKVMSFIDPSVIKPFNVVLDAGSGMAGLVAPKLFDRLPCRTTRLCFEIDGTFPNHEANPLIEENRQDITAEVVRQQADVGIAWDGDADRCFFIDGSGEFISGDFVTALLAEAFLLKNPGATIIYDLRASHAVKDVVARYGGRALMNRVGHAFIKQRMRQEDGIFAGEVTGHYYFRDFYYADNGFIPALLILELMSKKNSSLRDLLQPYRERYFISGEINTKLKSMDEVPARLAAIESRYKDATIQKMDGVSVDYPDWHFNVRASNTEPLLRLNLEAATPALMEKRRDEVLGIIRG